MYYVHYNIIDYKQQSSWQNKEIEVKVRISQFNFFVEYCTFINHGFLKISKIYSTLMD